jgi:HSP90 family molecular chaperone
MNTENSIEFNFTYFALKALGNSLYSNPWVAVSELVANGLDAGAKNVKVLIDIRDKEHATIEILDDGCGMSYEDIANKYVIIGRNRRYEEPNEKKFGRKGVGKLAALYLTSHYYIFTKKSGEVSAWEIDTSLFKDSDIPKLRKVDE